MSTDNPGITTISTQQVYDLALLHHHAGRLHEAEQLYRQILSQQPQHFKALQHLGVIAYQTGQNDAAVNLIRRAIALAPDYAEAHCNLGNALQAKRQLNEAIAAYRAAIALKPDYAAAYYNLGNALQTMEQLDEAIAAYHHAIGLQPDHAAAHFNLGNALQAKGQFSEAIAAYRAAITLKSDYIEAYSNLGGALTDNGQLDEAIAVYRAAIALKPDYAEAHNNLGVALIAGGQFSEAIAAYRAAIVLKPNYAEAYSNLGGVLTAGGQFDEAIAAFRQAVALRPNYAEGHNNLGNALQNSGQFDQALAAYRQSIALAPEFAEAHSNLGNSFRAMGQLDEAAAAYRHAILLKPDYAEAHSNMATLLLLRGDFKRGWQEYEWRWKSKSFPSNRRNFSQPQWNGGLLEARTLLLHAEQGIGDALQFIRYLPMVAQRGGKIIIECQAELQRLLQTMPGKCQIIIQGEPLPAFDLHCPLLSLPLVFDTTLENIPNNVPYLYADAQDAKRWRERLNDYSSNLKVGLVWAGNPAQQNDRNRSIKLSSLAPLARVHGVRFFSLQKGLTAAAQAKMPPAGMELIDWTADLKDFADTAALIVNLDLVISVDTSVAHLAGAMGKPVWVLLALNPPWRWLLEREDSPWYPTMRLFRQKSFGDWDEVIERVAERLAAARRDRAE